MASFEQHRATFTHLIPELVCMTKAHFRHLDTASREEAVHKVLCLAWEAFYTLIRQGRADEPNRIKSVLWFAIKRAKTGRDLSHTGNTNAIDASSAAKRGKTRFEQVDLRNLVSDSTPVPDAVSFRLDVPAFMATLTNRQQRMAEDLIVGEKTSAVAAKFGVSSGAVSQFRNTFKTRFKEFMAG